MSPEASHPQNSLNFFLAIAISAAIVILWLFPVFAHGGKLGTAGAGPWGLVSIIAFVFTIIAPLVYGWYSRDGTGAILIGVVPFLLTTGISRIISNTSPPGTHYLVWSVLYVVSLSIVGGLEGHFAAEKNTKSLLIALVLAGIWTGIFFTGMH
jgi:hypothetical protein